MLIGVPKEIKNHEYRVGLTPAAVRQLVEQGHSVIVETKAGAAIGLDDDHYQAAGANIIPQAETLFERAELIIKVKEPQPVECRRLQPGQTLFTYLHLAADSLQAQLLQESGCTAIAYETVTDASGRLPLLAPMSEVAGRMSVQVGAHCLENSQGGRGVLLGGVPGVTQGEVVILGGGVVGTNAAQMALGMGAHVTIVDQSLPRLRQLNDQFGARIQTLYPTTEALEEKLQVADLVIGAVLVPGAAAPKLVRRAMLPLMKRGAVMVDVAIDQGGCFETSHPTTHEQPTYIVDGIIHYCVTNMPGAVARTSTFALNNATLPYVCAIANKGWKQALQDDPHLRNGLNVCNGHLTHQAVAEALKQQYMAADDLLTQMTQATQATQATQPLSGKITEVCLT
jgi:alanine dehydrogenase